MHRAPELSGAEHETAALIVTRLAALGGCRLVTDLGGGAAGGTGVAAVFGAGKDTLMIRCELDALPIVETGTPDWRSERPGVAHLCGHDGHMANLFAVAQVLARKPPDCKVVLLFQPAEETGQGAASVIADPQFATLMAPESGGRCLGISLHNMPGIPLGAVALRKGPMNCASRGLKLRLSGSTSHASEPEKGRSPGRALAALIPALGDLARDLPTEDPDFRLTTVTHARLGVPAFGITPGDAELYVTLRTLLDDRMAGLEAEARSKIAEASQGFEAEITIHEAFGHCVNAPEATALLEAAAVGLARADDILPMRASEDFGLFGQVMPTAMILLGSGETCPALHAPDYDFPDALIGHGARLFLRAIAAFTSPS